MYMKKIIFTSFIVFQLVANHSVGYSQCAMCKSTVESNQKMEVTNRAKGLNTGILYLMIIPYAVFGVIGFLWYKSSKKAKEEREKINSVLRRSIG